MNASPPDRRMGVEPHTPMGAGGEFDRLRAVLERLGDRAAPSGDDCAFVTIGSERLAVSTDLVVEGTHFQLGWLELTEIGWRAAAAACSDLAAVAAQPLGVLVSVGTPEEWPREFLADLLEGVGALVDAIGASVWGGDLVRSERLVIDMTVIGRFEPGATAVRRSGGRVGDGLWVTGSLGGPLAALRAWERRSEPDPTARERFAHPVPRVREAAWLRDHGATAMIDLSDGLWGDAGHLAAASGTRCVIEIERVPVHSALGSARDAIVSGEEYELLVAMPPTFTEEDAGTFSAVYGLPLSRVGAMQVGDGVDVLEDGKHVQGIEGWRQFG